MKWIRVENPDTDETNFIDLHEVDGGRWMRDGSVAFWMKSGRTILISGTKEFLDKVWKMFVEHTGITAPSMIGEMTQLPK
jgi:hypothetical protein